MNKKNYLLGIIYLIPFFGNAQIKIDSSKSFLDTARTVYLSNELNAKFQMKIYSDSLNNLKENAPLPKFLFNPCFDNQPIYWKNLHTPISLRSLVINEVHNKKVLLRMSKEKRLRNICKEKSSFIIPYSEKSYYILIQEKLQKK
ncbi:MAG: hypothetical protein ABI723_11320 [Bacteroidia bacterium]